DVLGGVVDAVIGVHDDLVDVVGVGVGRRLEVGCGEEGDLAGGGIDVELRGVGAGQRVAPRADGVGVGGRHGVDDGAGRRVLRLAGCCPRRDGRGDVVGVGHRDADVLGGVVHAVISVHDDLV